MVTAAWKTAYLHFVNPLMGRFTAALRRQQRLLRMYNTRKTKYNSVCADMRHGNIESTSKRSNSSAEFIVEKSRKSSNISKQLEWKDPSINADQLWMARMHFLETKKWIPLLPVGQGFATGSMVSRRISRFCGLEQYLQKRHFLGTLHELSTPSTKFQWNLRRRMP